jgi:hypothetical protein
MIIVAGIQRTSFDIGALYRKFCVKLAHHIKEMIMSEEKIETVVEPADENEPIYYKPKSLNLVATVAGILSWVVLVGFILVVVGHFLNLQELSQGATFSALIKEAGARTWIYTNLLIPVLTGLGLFITLQGVSIGLNVLLEIDFNIREPKS